MIFTDEQIRAIIKTADFIMAVAKSDGVDAQSVWLIHDDGEWFLVMLTSYGGVPVDRICQNADSILRYYGADAVIRTGWVQSEPAFDGQIRIA